MKWEKAVLFSGTQTKPYPYLHLKPFHFLQSPDGKSAADHAPNCLGCSRRNLKLILLKKGE
jgi:hypothetical protein